MCKSPTGSCPKALSLSNYPAGHKASNDRKDDSVIMLSAAEQHTKRQPDYRTG